MEEILKFISLIKEEKQKGYEKPGMKFLIKLYNLYYPDDHVKTGEAITQRTGDIWNTDKENLEKISYRTYRGLRMKGKNHHMYGKNHKEESKKKTSKSMKEYWKNKKAI